MSGTEMKNLLESLEQVNEIGPLGRESEFGRKVPLQEPHVYDEVVNEYKGILDWTPNTNRLQLIDKLARDYKFNFKELLREIKRRDMFNYMPPTRDFGDYFESEEGKPKPFSEIFEEIQKKG